MATAPDPGDGQKLFLSHLPIIERTVRYACRRNHLAPEEADDFESHVKLRLLSDDCAVLRQFRGGSNIQTYLSVVIERLFVDYRRTMWGKWRPSAEATRLGALGVLLDRLVCRDGYTVDQAYEIITTNHRVTVARAEVERLAAALPRRQPRRFESDDSLEERPAQSAPADAVVAAKEAADNAKPVSDALRAALAALNVNDRLVLMMRFVEGRTVAQIAAVLGLDQKALYRRIDRLLVGVRRQFEQAGLDKSTVLSILETEQAALELGEPLHGIADRGPSVSVGADKWR